MSGNNYTGSGIRYVSSEIERMADALDLNEQVARMGLRIFHQVLESDYEPTYDAVAPACLYMGNLVVDQGVTLRDFEEVSRRNKKTLGTVSRSLKRELDLPGVKVQTPEDIVESKCAALDIKEHKGNLKRLLKEVDDQYKGSNSPTSVAAAVIYIGADIFDYDVTQQDIADELNVTPVTIRNQYPKVIDNSSISPPTDQRKFSSYDKAVSALRADIDLPDHLWDEVEARVTLTKNEFGNSTSKAGVVLAAVYITVEDTDQFDELADANTLSQYAAVGSETINRHRTKFTNGN